MCGRFNTLDDREARLLMAALGVSGGLKTQLDIRPTTPVTMVMDSEGERKIREAIWWLILKQEDKQLKADQRWASFNSRADKLLAGKVHKIPPVSFRAIIPASGYHEWSNKIPYNIKPVSGAMAFGAMAKCWQTEAGPVYSTSIVTLPGHPKLKHIHEKSLPLMLRPQDYDAWLDNRLPTESLQDLFIPRLHEALQVTPLKDTRTLEASGEQEVFDAD